MPDYPMLIPCICTVCGHEWEAFFPDGIHDVAIGIQCPECIGLNVNGRFKDENA